MVFTDYELFLNVNYLSDNCSVLSCAVIFHWCSVGGMFKFAWIHAFAHVIHFFALGLFW